MNRRVTITAGDEGEVVVRILALDRSVRVLCLKSVADDLRLSSIPTIAVPLKASTRILSFCISSMQAPLLRSP